MNLIKKIKHKKIEFINLKKFYDKPISEKKLKKFMKKIKVFILKHLKILNMLS